MERTSPQIVTAHFARATDARKCLEALNNQGFAKPWMALTRPAGDGDWADAYATTAPSQNEITETSDGAPTPAGRAFADTGHSLRRALEDRGVSASAALRIDNELAAEGAVVIVDADDRRRLSEQIIGRTGGSIAAIETGSVPAGHAVAATSA